MAMQVSPARLRDELTELWLGAAAGDHLLAAGVHQAPVLIRAVRPGDRGRHASLTQFRRRLHRVLRVASREPVIVTVCGTPTLWLGCVQDLKERRARRQRPPRGIRGKV
jgi:hypothetical protein